MVLAVRSAVVHRWTLSMTWLLAVALMAPVVAHAQAEQAATATGQAELAPAAAPSPATEAEKIVAEPAPPPAAPAPLPAAVPATPTAIPKSAAPDHGLLLIPYLGLNVPVGDIAQRYGTGPRLGVLAGWHLRPRISLNAEATFDFMDADSDPSFVRPHEYVLDLAVSPLLHLRSGAIVIGPKLGWFVNRRWQTSDPGGAREGLADTGSRSTPGYVYVPNLIAHHAQGFTVGLNLGAFATVGTVKLGMIATVAVRQVVTHSCDDACGSLIDPLVLGISVAAMF
jgi:hypothetical protein